MYLFLLKKKGRKSIFMQCEMGSPIKRPFVKGKIIPFKENVEFFLAKDNASILLLCHVRVNAKTD
ncbi:MAG: hypothetical protein U9O82_14440 [Thermodesulfobacteriota bacterium]|nr:hypothetical protein [Thermodesulfobacteriota bacterium]